MKLKNTLIGTALAVLATFSSWAAEERPDLTEKFRANELSLDMFGSVSIGQETINRFSSARVRHDGRLGAGLGANYYFTRHVGVSFDAYSESTQHSFVDSLSGNLNFRLPFEPVGLAPYVFGGGGRQLDPTHVWFAQAGGGLEFRLTRNWGVFTDARYVITDGTRNYGLGRLGLRLTF